MTLNEFFAALQNPNMVVTVTQNNAELTRIYASGYEQLLASLLAKEVSKITVMNQNAATVELVGQVSG